MIVEEVDNLGPFLHPVTKRHYRYMAPVEVNGLVEELFRVVAELKDLPLVSVESGAYPLGKLLAARLGIDQFRVKVPRLVDSNLNKYILFMLTADECSQLLSDAELAEIGRLADNENLQPFTASTREEAVRHFSHYLQQPAPKDMVEAVSSYDTARVGSLVAIFNIILGGTTWSEMLAQPFLLLEEFVTSGTVLSVLNKLFALFNSGFAYSLVSYSFNMPRETTPSFLHYSVLYGSPWDQPRAYPFENRLDLLGFYYTETGDELIRTNLAGTGDKSGDPSAAMFSVELEALIVENDVVQSINQFMKLEPLRDYNNVNHALRFALFLLEKRDVPRSFWGQLFEMYAPSWSPLPISFHLDFVGAYYQAQWLIPLLEPLLSSYKLVADELLNQAANHLMQAYDSYWLELQKNS